MIEGMDKNDNKIDQEKIAFVLMFGSSLALTAATILRTLKLQALKFGTFITLECIDSV